jgi:hypothetical protein
MKWQLMAFVASLCTAWNAAIAQPNAAAPARPQFVLELAFLDGVGTTSPQESTALGVTQTGEIYVPREGDGALVVADRMQPQQVAGLVKEIEQAGRLREIDSGRLRNEVQQACQLAGFNPIIEGAAATIIRCDAGEGRAEARCDGLSVMAARFPDFPELQRLLAVQLRLQNVAAVARVGGEQASQQLATIANRTLQLSQPELPPLTPRDLSMVRQLATGSRYIQFYRLPTKSTDELLVSVFETPGQPPQVSVLANPSQAAP